MKKTNRHVAAIAVVQLAGLVVASAATVTIGTSVPSVGDGIQNLAYSTGVGDNTAHPFVPNNYIGNGNGLTVGQSFTTGTETGYLLNSISVRQVSWGPTSWDLTGGNVTARVLSLSGDPGGVLTAVELESETVAVGGASGGVSVDATPGSPAWLTFEFTTAVSLDPSSWYGFVISSDGDAGNDGLFFEWDGSNANPYAGGGSFTVPNGNLDPWSGGTTSDRVFVANMTAVPEPSFALLGGLGLLGLLRRRR